MKKSLAMKDRLPVSYTHLDVYKRQVYHRVGQGQLQRHIEKKEEKRKGQSIKRPRLGSSCTLFQPSLRGSRRQGSISS